MKTRVVMGACAAVLGLFQAAPAGLIVSIDMDPSLAGIQSNRQVTLGEQFDIGVVFDMTADIDLVAYSFSVRFNSDALGFVARSETVPPPLESLTDLWDLTFGSDDPVLGSGVNYGQITAFEGASLLSELPGPFAGEVAKLTMQVLAAPDPATTIQVVPGAYTLDDVFFGLVDGGLKVEDISDRVEYQGGSFSLVPEPSSFALLAAGLSIGCAVIVGRRRLTR